MDGSGTHGCFNLFNSDCVVHGFTITNGMSAYGGGVNCYTIAPIIEQCIITGNSGRYGVGIHYGTAIDSLICNNVANPSSGGGGAYNTQLESCIISGNSAETGGGIFRGSATDCMISNNTATISDGGGGHTTTISHSIIIGNSAAGEGGGLNESTATHCIISGNSAGNNGGGLSESTAVNCIINRNWASSSGGGMRLGSAINCSISGNSAGAYSGGMAGGMANNCTVVGNSAEIQGGGVNGTTARNCIMWDNFPDNVRGGSIYNSCSPDLTAGTSGNITDDPLLVSASHIATNSLCRGTGNAAYASGTDIDGAAWQDPPSMGCDEKYDGEAIGGEIIIWLHGSHTLVSGYSQTYLVFVIGNISGFQVDFGNGTVVENTIRVANSWETPGSYDVVLTAYNGDYPAGVTVTETVEVLDAEATAMHVSTTGDDANDGTNWVNAKATIQAGVDAQQHLGGFVLIADGTYSPTGTITIAKDIRVQSVTGATNTIVDGGGTHGCFNLGRSCCVLSGLTITNGYVSGQNNGGAVCCDNVSPIIENCLIVGNESSRWGGGIYQGTVRYSTFRDNSAYSGGAIYDSTVSHCTIISNSASFGGGIDHGRVNYCLIANNTVVYEGGGARGCIANNCTIVANKATHEGSRGGGITSGTANNCIIWGNTAVQGWNNLYALIAINYSCSQEAHAGEGNITSTPLFMGADDYHLQATSPCIDAGSNAYMPSEQDLNGTPCPLDGDTNGTAIVDMGCYELLNPAADSDNDGLTDADEVNTHGTDPTNENTDGDDMDDGAELIADTDPNDFEDYFCVTAVSNGNPVTVYFNSSSSRLYSMLGCSNLVSGTWTNVSGTGPRAGKDGADTMQDTNVPAQGPYYRLEVQLP